ncbi:MAG: hypothetical protein RLZZ142_1261, partial [Verrucomicrobiota bacterium]
MKPPRSLRRLQTPLVALILLHSLPLAALQAAEHATTTPGKTTPPGKAPAGMVWIPGGEFSMGAEDPSKINAQGMGRESMADARPIHRVFVDGFWMDATEVTNEAFAQFVDATHYVTLAERKPSPEEFPGVAPEALKAGSIVFKPTTEEVPLNNFLAWWSYVPGANWRHPLGPGSDIQGKEKYPVVQIAYEDALAYAQWAGKRLPTEAEWEFAARGGLSGQAFAWGKDFRPDGKWMANTYQGKFPSKDIAGDGFAGLAPVAQFPPNGYGLYDISGNVWEWCLDWYRPDYYATLAKNGGVTRNPQGPADSFDPDEPGVPKRVHR